MSNEIRFTVLGNPIPKARARVTIRAGQKAHAFTPTRTRDWEARVKDAARPAMIGHRLFTGPVAVELWLWRGDRRRCDGDNLEKALTDACKGIVWEDDDQIVDMHRYKRLDLENPRALVRVWPLNMEELEW